MKKMITKAVDDLKAQSGKEEKTIKFNHQATLKNKSVKGKITLSKEGTINLSLTEIKGYSPSYIKRIANFAFKTALLPYAQVGDIVWTKHSGSLIVDNDYTLPKGSYYFGVGINSYLDCGGRTFFSDAAAKFCKNETASCTPGIGREYQLFKIVSL